MFFNVISIYIQFTKYELNIKDRVLLELGIKKILTEKRFKTNRSVYSGREDPQSQYFIYKRGYIDVKMKCLNLVNPIKYNSFNSI